MNRVKWITDKVITLDKYEIPVADNLTDQVNQQVGIYKDTKLIKIVKMFAWPLVNLKEFFLSDGFIEVEAGKWIKQYVTKDTVFLEVGCGSMNLKRFLPATICYNAFDVLFSEFHLLRVLKKDKNINLCIASATEIPIESNTVSLIVSTECFEHIPEIEKAISEIQRIAVPNAKLICSIPNNYCYKYKKKGPHPGHINNWAYDEFIKFMGDHGFQLLNGYMKGFWISLPLWLTKVSCQLPLTSKKEFYNTNFFFVFDVIK